MDKAVLILTCYNRKEKTTNCIRSVLDSNEQIQIEIVLVDDKSTDGTKEAVRELAPRIHIVEGTGGLYWNGGMHIGMEYALKKIPDAKYYVMLNDDVEFYPGVFEAMARELDDKTEVLVGATQADDNSLSYGGIVYKNRKSLKLRTVGPDEPGVCCDTFNANCVMIPAEIFKEAGATDSAYTHSMGDFDYGFTIQRMGYPIHVFHEYVGRCNDNPAAGTWQDTSLPVLKRLRLKEGAKGLPFKDWFRFLRKNFGLDVAIVRSFTPYIKILLRR